MVNRQASFLSPKLEARSLPEKGGYGVFAREVVQAGELLVVWGGVIFTAEQLQSLPPERRQHTIQVEEGLFQAPVGLAEPADFINHSCTPNAGLSGQIALVAMRMILPDEEACFDYAMSDGSAYDEFECQCNTPHCRGRVTGNDWANPDLWERYGRHFSPYLLRRIEKLRAVPYRNGRTAQTVHRNSGLHRAA